MATNENASSSMHSLENLREIYSQHWQHIRHIEKERLAFTSIYLTFMAVGLAYVLKSNGIIVYAKYVILLFLLFLSAIGLGIMSRILVTFWFHYSELKRLTGLLYEGEKLDYESSQKKVELEIKNNEPSFWWLNRFFIRITKKNGVMLPLTVLFPLVFLIGFILLTALLMLFVIYPDLNL